MTTLRPTSCAVMWLRLAIVAGVVCATVRGARASVPSPERARALIAGWWDEVSRRLDAAARPRPPVPVAVVWQSRRIASVDLAAPLLALAAADVDADGRAELVALTAREVIVLEAGVAGTVTITARASLPPMVAIRRPRDPVGTVVVTPADGVRAAQVWAHASDRARGGRWAVIDGALEAREPIDEFPLCPGVGGQLSPGRNYLVASTVAWATWWARPVMPPTLYSLACITDAVTPQGTSQAVVGVVDRAGTLTVRALVACGGDTCSGADADAHITTVRGRGSVFALADVDNDGHLEILTTLRRPLGFGDQVSVYADDGDDSGPRRVARSRRFAGSVAGLAVGDVDGDGDRDVVAAVRLVGSNKVDLWALTRW